MENHQGKVDGCPNFDCSKVGSKILLHIDMAMGVMLAQNPRLENVISPLLMLLVFLTMQRKMTPLLK
jgi:hypothetical protein